MSESAHNDLERDATLAAIYRASEQEVPPSALDAAILAAARREVGARPRRIGYSFTHSWRLPLSIAAVLVLSVSLVTLMREEAPELFAPPRVDTPVVQSARNAPASAEVGAAEDNRGFVRDLQPPKSIGLKPPQPEAATGLGMRPPEIDQFASQPAQEKKTDKPDAEAARAAGPAKRREVVAGGDLPRDSKVVASAEQPREAAKLDARREAVPGPAPAPLRSETAKAGRVAEPAANVLPSSGGSGSVAGALAENQARAKAAADADRVEPAAQIRQGAQRPPVSAPLTSPASPAPPAVAMNKAESGVDLPPEKWVSRIEELRKLGRVDEAKASLAEFKRRYPDYRLPDALRDWANP
jgi:hypothetical protein